jgi:hypothetical protein
MFKPLLLKPPLLFAPIPQKTPIGRFKGYETRASSLMSTYFQKLNGPNSFSYDKIVLWVHTHRMLKKVLNNQPYEQMASTPKCQQPKVNKIILMIIIKN